MPNPLLCLQLLTVFLLALAGTDDDEIVREFRRYFRKFTDTATRVEAIMALEDAETPEVVEVLSDVLADADSEVVRAAVEVLSSFETATASSALFVRLEAERREAVRVGLLEAIAIGGYAGPAECLLSCLGDKAWDVRRRAIGALVARPGGEHAEALTPLCTDREPAVRCAAFEGLAALASERVLPLAREALDDPVWQVRASAVAALGAVRHVDSIGPLIDRMETEQGRLVEDIARSLEQLTGRAFGLRTALWRKFWDDTADRYRLPTDEELARTMAARAASAARYSPPAGAVAYHGIATPSRALLFVIDVSGSMENHVVDRERFKPEDYPSLARMDIVKTELAKTIAALDSAVEFNILSFATEVRRWKKKAVRANVLNKRSARDWTRKLKAIGGTSKEDLARVGLVGTANLEGGKTNSYGALMDALEVASARTRSGKYLVGLDTIFFLSDGRPTHGELVDPGDILLAVRRANELRKVVIHTIAIGEFQKNFMRRLAEQNGGSFVDLGR
ncbi:MAG TPA: HEAT repeat domain-containing protein [Planctomycetota bacterium]|nr:HEAT repeat domain-containing protein [Planctomycetota bacterium]